MALVKINWKPDAKTLREFSELWLFFLGMVAMPLAWSKGHPRLAAAFWLAAVGGRLVGAFRPQWMKYLFVGMTVATWPIGWAVSHLAMAVIYYGVFTPVACLFRLLGRDPLKRKLDRSATTYWEAYNPDQGAARYLRQF